MHHHTSISASVFGVVMIVIGSIGLASSSPPGMSPYLVLIAGGLLFDNLFGAHLLLLALMLPFHLLSYAFFLPIARRGGGVYYPGLVKEDRVLAYSMLPDRIILVRHLEGVGETILGESVVRGPGMLTRLRKALDSAAVADVALDDARLGEAVDRWNHEVLGKRRKIELDRHSSGYRHAWEVIGSLWRSKKTGEEREDVIRLAVWLARAEDEIHGRGRPSL